MTKTADIKRIIFLITFSIVSILGFFVIGGTASAEGLKAPIITQVSEDNKNTFKPLINGSTDSGTLVRIYIDGIYNGKTNFLASDSGEENFIYQSFIDLKPGAHTVWAVAEDKEGNKSQPSNILDFKVREGVPAPTLFTSVVNSDTNYSQPFIVGLSKNNLVVKIYIDGNLNGEVKIGGETDTISFYYKPVSPLQAGKHTVYAIAADESSRESRKSNIVNFTVYNPPSVKSEEENKGEEAKVESEEAQNQEESAPISTTRNWQSSRNLIIFIIFVVIIIGWLIWTNRKLIEEKLKKIKSNR